MKDRYYLLNPGKLFRKENTLYFESGDKKTPIPVNKIYDIYATENATISSGVFNILNEHKVPLHSFSYGGKYLGTFLPPDRVRSGLVTVEQADSYNNSSERLEIAKSFVEGSIENQKWVLSKFDGLTDELNEDMSRYKSDLSSVSRIPALMELEGKAQKLYYKGISDILEPTSFEFNRRTKEPPENEFNSLLSYVNTLIYSRIITEIYYTRLDQSISFLHEPQERRFSLSLDVAEIYKPIIGHRVILSLIRQNKLDSEENFDSEGRAVLISESGKKKLLKEFDKQLNRTRKHPETCEPVRWRRWARIEGHKITKKILQMEDDYKPTTLG